MAVKKGLGKGLDSLITDKVNTKPAASKNNPTPKSEHAADAIMMNITKVEPNREQPRKKFDEDALLELAESIKQYGVLQPLLVQEREDYYEIVAGERRWRAAKIAGIKEIPVIIKKLTRQEIMEISLIENIQREDLNPIEEALAFKRLLTEFNLKQDEVAERVSKSRTAVTNAMRLLKLNEKVQQMVIDEMLTTGHARALLGIEDQEQQYIIAQKIFDEKLSVRDTEKLVKSLQNEKKKKKEEKEKLKVTDNLSELDAKSAEELVKEGKKGITAEFNGIISKADIKQGAAVTQGMELFTIENTDKASVDVTLSKYDYNTVKEGQSVEITLGDNTYQGTVTKMSHIAVQNEKGTPVISATVSIDDPDEDIFLGVDAKVKIYAASAKNVVTLPVEVVNIGKEGSFCYVIEDGLVTKRNITTGISSEDYVEITDGIKEGEEVIADLGDYTEGMEVQAVPEQTGEDADE